MLFLNVVLIAEYVAWVGVCFFFGSSSLRFLMRLKVHFHVWLLLYAGNQSKPSRRRAVLQASCIARGGTTVCTLVNYSLQVRVSCYQLLVYKLEKESL